MDGGHEDDRGKARCSASRRARGASTRSRSCWRRGRGRRASARSASTCTRGPRPSTRCGGAAGRPAAQWSSSTMCKATTSGRKRADSRWSAYRAGVGPSIPTRSGPGCRRMPRGWAPLVTPHPGDGARDPARGYARSTAIAGPPRHQWAASRGRRPLSRDGVQRLRLQDRARVGCAWRRITEGRAKTVDIEAFSLGRFAEGKTVEGPYPYETARTTRPCSESDRLTMAVIAGPSNASARALW